MDMSLLKRLGVSASLLMLSAIAAAAEPRLHLVTSIKPLQLLAMAVAGDGAEVELLLDPRMSPHDYQFRPSDRHKLQHADAVFWIGPALETFLAAPLGTLPGSVRVVALQEKNADDDPHIWMDPLKAAAMARRIATVLSELEPARSQQWRDNAERLAAALNQQDAALRHQFAAIKTPRPYLVAHDAYRHFEQRYGLHHAAALTDSADHAPGARNVVQIQQLLDNGGIQCVLRESQHEPKVLQTLLRGRSVRSVTVDGLAGAIPANTAGAAQFYREFGEAMLTCVRP